MLKIYNSMTQQKELFKPLTPGHVLMYVCGLTVYDFSHVGNIRSFIAFDVIMRYLQFSGLDVKLVRNITDIDDKIINRANENKEPYQNLTKRFIQALHEDFLALSILPPAIEPRATDYIPKMIEMIETLIQKGYAYVGANGDVYYDVCRFVSYGELSHRKLDELEMGARVEVAEAKHSPLDFVLWKMAKPGEPFWVSPWGNGRPGWHIECSVMATVCLGKTIDIHGGGKDLIFPHHENERAQSEAANGQEFVNYWMHAGHLQINREKMSKSLGNFFTIREVLQKYHSEIIRYFIISSHYRSALNYSDQALENAKQGLMRLYTALQGIQVISDKLENSEYEKQFIAAMDDDFNTPEALAVLFNLAKEINKLKEQDKQKAFELAGLLRRLGQVLGILQDKPEDFLQDFSALSVDEGNIEKLITKRNEARKNKNWAEADKIRRDLEALNILLGDTSTGTIWRSK